jgi:hypothetical protein
MNLPKPYSPARRDALEVRFARQVGTHLMNACDVLPSDIGERLRVAREQALLHARQRRLAAGAHVVANAGGSATLGSLASWGLRVASVMPLLVLVLGLVLIHQVLERAQIDAAAEVDAALLADDLPPAAYRDAGFVEFLRQPPQ